MVKSTRRLVICLDNKGYEASLERWKVYTSLPDARVERFGLIRVIDQSGEDYLYRKETFRSVLECLTMPKDAEM